MSDFLGDDFTAELRGYFLDQLSGEVNKYIASADEGSWSIFRDEILEKSPDWVVDARTNEFTFFAAWYEQLSEGLKKCEDFQGFSKTLQLVQAYLQKLSVQKKDSDEFPGQFLVQDNAGQWDIYLHCHIGPQEMILPVFHVVEVIARPSVFPLPLPEDNFSGLIPYRGEAIPVFNLKNYGFQMSQNGVNSYFVVCDVGAERFAFEVTQADMLLEVSSRELQSKSGDAALAAAPFISHFVVRENKNILVFDLEELVAA